MFRPSPTLTLLLFPAILLCCCLPASSQTKCVPIFVKEYKSNGYLEPYAIKYLPSGDMLVAGRDSIDAVTGYDAVIMKISNAGIVSWSKQLGGALKDAFTGICLLNDGGYIVYGTTSSFGYAEGRPLVTRFAADGSLLWSRQFGFSAAGKDRIKAMELFSDGSVIGTLNMNDSTSLSDAVVFKMAVDGTVTWSQRFDNGNADGFTSLAFDGNTVVAGGYYTTTTRRGVITKLDAGSGSPVSSKTLALKNAPYQEEVIGLEIYNNRISYALWTWDRTNTYPFNSLLLYQADMSGNKLFSRLIVSSLDGSRLSVRRTPDNGFLYLQHDRSTFPTPSAYKISDNGLINWVANMSTPTVSNRPAESFDLAGTDGFVFAGYHKLTFNGKNTQYIAKMNNFGESGDCWYSSYGIMSTDTASYTESAFAWSVSQPIAPVINTAVAPFFDPMPLTVSTACEKTECSDITPIPEECKKSYHVAYSNGESITFRDIATTSDGGKVLVGDKWYRGIVVKTKSNGDVAWSKTVNELGHIVRLARVIKTKDNNILVFGDNQISINHGVSQNIIMVKMDNSGNILWSRYLERTSHMEIEDVVVTDDGGFVVLINEIYGGASLILRYDANGNMVWQKESQYSNGGPVYRSVAVNETGLYVGYDLYANSISHVGFGKLNAATGVLIWSKTYKLDDFTITRVNKVTAINDTVYAFINATQQLSFVSYLRRTVLLKLTPAGAVDRIVALNRDNVVNSVDDAYATIGHTAMTVTLTKDNDFVLADQVLSGTDTMLNVTRIKPDASLLWSHNFLTLNKHYVYNIHTEGKNVLLCGTVKNPHNLYANFTDGYVLKINDKGFLTGNPAASCQPVDAAFSTTAVNYTEVIDKIAAMVPLTGLSTNDVRLISNDYYMDADLFCNEPATCNTAVIKGNGNACSAKDTIVYYLENAVNCDVAVTWRYDTALLKAILITSDTIKLVPKKPGASFITAQAEGSCFTSEQQLPATVLLSASNVTLGPDTMLCMSRPIDLNAGPGYSSYVWNDNSTNPVLTVTAPGKYYVTVTDNCGGKGSDTVIVTSSSNAFHLTGNTTKCNNDTVTLTATKGLTNYKWSPLVNIITSGNTALAFPGQTTKYFASATLWPGCDVTDSLLLTVLQSPLLSLGTDITVCNYELVTLHAATGFNSYSWSNGANTANIITQQPGQYSLSATYNNGCVSRDTILVKHYPVVRVNLGKDISICENEPAKLLPGVFKNYLWSTGSTNASITVDATGLYWVKVTDNNGCAAADSINILEVFATPKNFLKDTAGICPGDELALAPAQNYVQYAWQGNVNSKLLNVYTPGTYVLTVTDNNGCRGADSIQVYLKNYCPNTIYFPNAFTPNGDTKNPTFRPIVTGNMEKFRFAVYNQYGQMIFSSNEPRRGWDGKLGGKLQSSGNYVWICEYKFVGAGAVTRKGSCLLLK